jgi:hypothetical protein
MCSVLDCVKPISQCRRRGTCILNGEPLGKGRREWGGKGGGSVYSQPGIRVDGNSRHDTKEGFQVSKRGIQGIRVGISKQYGDYHKDWGIHLHILC